LAYVRSAKVKIQQFKLEPYSEATQRLRIHSGNRFMHMDCMGHHIVLWFMVNEQSTEKDVDFRVIKTKARGHGIAAMPPFHCIYLGTATNALLEAFHVLALQPGKPHNDFPERIRV